MIGQSSGAFAGEPAIQSVSLNLTALMDILSNLLFFLLASYTTQALEVEQKADMHLPSSSSQLKLQPSLTITVSRRDIKVAGVPVAEVRDGQIVGPIDEGDKVVALFDRLRHVKTSRAATGRDDMPGSDVILLLADRGTDSSVIMKVLKTAGISGFVNVRFGVISQ